MRCYACDAETDNLEDKIGRVYCDKCADVIEETIDEVTVDDLIEDDDVIVDNDGVVWRRSPVHYETDV